MLKPQIWAQKIARVKIGLLQLQKREQWLLELHSRAQEAIQILERFPNSWWQSSQTERKARQQLAQGEKFLAGEAKRAQQFFERTALLEQRMVRRERKLRREIAKRVRREKKRKPPNASHRRPL